VGGKRWGVAKEVKLVSVNVFNADGVATWASFTAGIDYCTAHQRNSTDNIIVNMSMGGPVNPTFDAIVGVLLEEGAIVVAAAGNQNSLSCSRSPPNALGVIGVGNSALTDTRDLSSNYGACVDIWAPGIDVKAASSVCDSVDYCWQSLTGTSMASALVSGAYALYLGAKKAQAITVPINATKREVAQLIKHKLLTDATSIPSLGVLGSADKLLCLAPLNDANGTSIAALTSIPAAAAAAKTTPAAIPPNNTKAADAGMTTESIGEHDPVLQMPVGPGEGGIGPDGKEEESKEEDEKPAEKKDADKKDEKEEADEEPKPKDEEPKPKDAEDDKPAEGEKKADAQTSKDEKPADSEKKPAGDVFQKST
jgi:subtilisin family serine protease